MKLKILKNHFPNVYKLIENTEYNSKQNISDYFGKEIIVIYSGHGGTGWNYRKLIGKHDDGNYYILERTPEYRSLIHKDDWVCRIILPEKFEDMNNYFKPRRGVQPTIINPIRID